MSITPTQPANGHEKDRIIVFEDVAIAFDENVVLDGVSFQLHKAETKILLGVAGPARASP